MGRPARKLTADGFVDLKQAVIRLLAVINAKTPLPSAMFDQVTQALTAADVRGFSLHDGSYFPALEMLPDFAQRSSGAGVGAMADVVNLLNICKHGYPWIQNPNYRYEPDMQNYLSNSAFGNFIGGQSGMVPCGDVAVGFWMMGPGIDYPAHSHPAEELYAILSGQADWYDQHAGWTRRGPGDFILNASMVEHGMRTDEDPLLAMYCWRGDLDTLPTHAASAFGSE